MHTRWVVLVALLTSSVARADAARDAAAKEHYEAGTAAFNLGEWLKAVDEYKKAYTAKPEPVLLYDIAQSYRLANDLPNAVFFYKSYLRNQPNAPNRHEIDDRIRKLEQQIHQQQQVASQPPNTPQPLTSSSPSPSPSRESTATTPPASSTTPAPSPPTAATTPPAPEPAAPAPAASEPAPSTSPALQLTQTSTTPKEKTPVYKKWWLWTIVGGVVVVGVGVGLGVALSGNTAPSTHLGTTGVF